MTSRQGTHRSSCPTKSGGIVLEAGVLRVGQHPQVRCGDHQRGGEDDEPDPERLADQEAAARQRFGEQGQGRAAGQFIVHALRRTDHAKEERIEHRHGDPGGRHHAQAVLRLEVEHAEQVAHHQEHQGERGRQPRHRLADRIGDGQARERGEGHGRL
jgi:hypothetical protein